MTGEGWLPGYIQDYDGQALTLVVPFSDAEYLTTHGVTECSVPGGGRPQDQRGAAPQNLRTAAGYCGLDRLRAAGAEGTDEVRLPLPVRGRDAVFQPFRHRP